MSFLVFTNTHSFLKIHCHIFAYEGFTFADMHSFNIAVLYSFLVVVFNVQLPLK